MGGARRHRGVQAGGPGGSRPAGGEQSRARYPDAEGFVSRGGVRIFYEGYGDGEPAVLPFPTWEIAAAIAQQIGRDVDYRPVASDGAPRP